VHIKDFYTPHIIKRRGFGRKKLSKPFAFFLAIVLLVGAAVSAFVFIIPNIGVRLNRRTYFVLTLGTSTSLGEAESLSSEVKNGGGGGFIINDGIFHVSAAAYLTRQDADGVAARMDGFETGVFVVDVPRVRVRAMDNRADNRALRDILLFSAQLIEYVIYQNVRLDTEQTTDSAIIYLFGIRLESIKEQIAKLENLIYLHYDNQFLVYTLEFFVYFLYDFNKMISITSGDGLVTHRLKYFSVKHLLRYQALIYAL